MAITASPRTRNLRIWKAIPTPSMKFQTRRIESDLLGVLDRGWEFFYKRQQAEDYAHSRMSFKNI
jgi:hypothetical protein